jgi:hypothetical protein
MRAGMGADRAADVVMTYGVEIYKDDSETLLERWTFPNEAEYKAFCSGIDTGIRAAGAGSKVRHITGAKTANYAGAVVEA